MRAGLAESELVHEELWFRGHVSDSGPQAPPLGSCSSAVPWGHMEQGPNAGGGPASALPSRGASTAGAGSRRTPRPPGHGSVTEAVSEAGGR